MQFLCRLKIADCISTLICNCIQFFSAIEKLGGLETEQDYPYEGEDEKCDFIKSKTRVQLKGAVNISHDETDMAKWLVANGPISIAINANAMQFYMGGISHPWKFLCSPGSLDHGVLIVGYGVHSKYDHFLSQKNASSNLFYFHRSSLTSILSSKCGKYPGCEKNIFILFNRLVPNLQ